MHTVIMPKMGDGMEEGTLLKWLKSEGDAVKEGEPIAEIATDKATVEVEAPGDGILKGISVQEGANVPVGEPMAFVLAEGESLPSGASSNGRASASGPTASVPAATPSVAQPAAPTPEIAPDVMTDGTESRIKATPLVRRLAKDHHVDLRQVTGTGPGGRIVERDLRAYLAAPQTAPVAPAAAATAPVVSGESRVEPMSRLRQIIAQRTTQTMQTVPHFYLTIEVDMGEAMVLRQRLNSLDESLPKISVNDLITRASVLALQKHPIVNAAVDGNQVVYPSGIHIGIAVAVPDGLIVPVIKHCEQLSVRKIAAASKQLIEKARDGKLMPDEMSGNTFSISNLGMFDIEEFTAIINPPASAILAVGSVRKTPVIKDDGSFEARQRMKVTMSCDHRTIDGATGALFLQDLKRYLEMPLLMLD